MGADLADSAAGTLPVASQRLAIVVENVAIARDTYRLRLEDPVLARSILPGQFVMIRPAADGADDPLLGRPFALYDVVTDTGGTPIAIDIVYLVVGRGTAALARRRPGRRAFGLGTAGQRFRPSSRGICALCCRRHWPDAISGIGPMVVGQDVLRHTCAGSGFSLLLFLLRFDLDRRASSMLFSDLTLWRAYRRIAGGAARFPPGGHRRRDRDRRRFGRPPWVRDRPAGPSATTGRAACAGRRLRTIPDAPGLGPYGRTLRDSLRRFA